MNSMQQDDSHESNSSRYPESEQGGGADRFQLTAKLMNKMEGLAAWRIDPSSLEFPEDTTEFHGGHATVSCALLNAPFDTSDNTDWFYAWNDVGEKVVAVKKMKIPSDKSIERILGLTLREAGFLVELFHENIIELKGFVENVSEGIVWLVFPWETNGNLRDFVASQDWEVPERISLIDDVVRGVEYLHSQHPPVCHGDLKSVNILVNSSCRAVITDFGSARHLLQEDPDAETDPELVESEGQSIKRLEATFSASTNTITLTGNQFTLRWAAPELLNDELPTLKVDIWAVGWIAYEVMTNAIPFEDVAKDSIVIRRVIQGDLPSITGDARMSLMLQLCCLMSECWSTDPTRRPTAMACRKSLTWMPMIVPNPNRTPAPMVPEVRCPHLLLRLGDMHQHQDDYANASKLYTEALQIFTDAADSKGTADTVMCLGQLHFLQGHYEEAVVLYTEALEIFTSIDDRGMEAQALLGLARAYERQRKYSEATTFYSDGLKIYTDINDNSGRAKALFGLADLHRVQGEYTQAAPLYSDALRICTDIGDRHGRASAFWALAEVHRCELEYDGAITFYSDALQIYTDIGDSRGRACAMVGLANVSSDQGRPKDAIELYGQALKIYEQIGDAGSVAYTSKRIAHAHRRLELVEETS